ncbi:MAG TPA: DUF3108 domain-containing protein [Bryobacteraceae bacterium]|jgi:hypothetical protein|nr:DUF3108 domain-containing protein [Bryobacteraceae bacterium]
MPSKLLLVLPLVWATVAIPQSNPLPPKETLYYNIEWRLISAGKAKVEWLPQPQPRVPSQIHFHLESVGLVSKLFKVEDDYSALLNPGFCAQAVQMTTHEGSRQRETKVTFDAETKKASYLERDLVKNTVLLSQEIDFSPCVHDVLGGLYFLRSLNLEPNQSAEIPVSDGKKSAKVKVEAQQREDIKTPEGAFKTIRYEVYLFNNVIYRRPAHLTLWLTDDRRKLPVEIRVRLQFTIGTITLQLEKHE